MAGDLKGANVRKLIDKILRAGEGRTLKKLSAITQQVNELESVFTEMTDEELKAQTADFRERYKEGESLDELLPEAFAAVREASVRTLGQRHYDVQIMGGAALHLGNIAEMKTGEGKTLVATLAAYLNAIPGHGVHIVTVNDYLASYQSELMGRVFRFLGMTTGCITTGLNPAQRREQYACDITYGTNNEFGFDYLRDNMAMSLDSLVQREHYFAIVDEVDSILIDEARTPLIISGPAEGDANKWYTMFSQAVVNLRRDIDYEVDEKKRTVGVLEPGIDKIEDMLGIDNLYESVNTPLIGYLNNAIKAKELFTRDQDYIVADGEVLIVDEHTGRVLPGRRYNEGMHQAIEAKEGVTIKAENQTLATITLQNYFRLYDKLSGMTGTAETEAEEFASTYDIGVVPIPTNRPMRRTDHTDLVYPTERGKFGAIVEDIKERFAKGQPVLVGTASVENSEKLSALLKKAHIPHEVLNAKQHEREAAVVAMAGRKGAVTVATNMAGRGTDIMLGGNAEYIAVGLMAKRGLDPEEDAEEYEKQWPQALAEAKAAVAKEHDEVVELGGLYVLGSERHESRRIDNQLRGRSGRQGDPGESRFYLSLDDDLMRLFGNTRATDRFKNGPEDQALDFKLLSSAIQRAQTQIESRNAEMRKNVLKYDDVMNEQRSTVYAERRRILEGEDVEDQISSFITFVVDDVVRSHTLGSADEWDMHALWTDVKNIYRPSFTDEELIEAHGGDQRELTREDVRTEILEDVEAIYQEREEELGSEQMRNVERQVLLTVLDRKWREHLYEMDYLKEGIGLRAMAQRDPLVEYKQEGYHMFQQMNDSIREETVRHLLNFELPSEKMAREAVEAAKSSLAAGAGGFIGQKTPVGSDKAQPSTEKILGIKRPETQKLSYSSSAGQSGPSAGRRGPAAGNKPPVGAFGSAAPQQQAQSGGEVDPYAGMNRAQRRAAKRRNK
ncbi:MAG: preprotein translocase subunit SecA [Trueperella sp.]|uniref:preprotein translocase subunit SecA n=1 Tax=Trueperella sp. TaxID=2699835 RepID=UPI0025EEB92D|nr:preprotein translocase subunit SecA [Trueperella sp.]MCI7304822.1 preprotein translocase subunit SecA [Trueperella sp.]MDY5404478.1 preprotein translocase subunit SecA [Trueperella sp.]